MPPSGGVTPWRDDADALRCVDSGGGIDDHQRPHRQRVMAGGNGDQLRTVGNRACVFQRPGIDKMLLEDRVGARAVRPHGPDRLDVGPTAFVIFPARVGDQAVVQRVGQVVAVLAHAQSADPASVGTHHVQIAARLVLVVLVALQRRAAALGHEDDVAVRAHTWDRDRSTRQKSVGAARAIHADFEDVRWLLRAPQTITLRAIEPALGRLIAACHGITEHHARPIPEQIHAVHMTGAERAVEQGSQAERWRGPRPRAGGSAIARNRPAILTCRAENTEVAPWLRYPGHVVQAHVGVRFLCEPLDEQQLVEIQPRIGEDQLTHGPPRFEVNATSLGLGRIAGQCAQPLFGLFQSIQVRRHVHAALAQMRGQFAAASMQAAVGKSSCRRTFAVDHGLRLD